MAAAFDPQPAIIPEITGLQHGDAAAGLPYLIDMVELRRMNRLKPHLPQRPHGGT